MAYKYSSGSVRRGDLYFEGDRTGDPTYIDFGQDTITLRPSGSQILFAKSDAIGINTTAPDEILTINGAESQSDQTMIKFTEDGSDRALIGINTSNNILIENLYSNKHIVFKASDAGTAREGLRLDGAVPEVVVNQTSDSLVDFRVESDNNTHMLFVDGGNDKVGIGTDTPIAELDVAGKIAITTEVSTPDQPADGQGYIYSKSDGKLYWRSYDLSETDLTATGGGGGSSPAGSDSQIQYNNGGSLGGAQGLVYDDSNTRVGIGGVATPLATLHVHSDTANNGTVMISQADNSGDASQLDLSKARGSGASPASVQNSDFVGQIRMLGYDGDSYDNFADIYAQAAGTISTTSHPTKIVIRTTQASATSPTTAVTIDENQDMTVAGAVLGKMRHMTHHRYNDGSGTGKEYIPWAGTSEQNSPSWITQGVAPYAGRLVKVLVRSSKTNPTMGSTIVGVHIATDGTTVINSTAEETVTVNVSNSNTSYAFNFANANHFGPGDAIGVSIDPTGAHGNVNVTCVWEYDIT